MQSYLSYLSIIVFAALIKVSFFEFFNLKDKIDRHKQIENKGASNQ